jgi:hypothetical protein
MSCVIFCLRIRGDHVESLPIPQARLAVDLGGPLKSKSARGENAARTLRLHQRLKLTTNQAYHDRWSGASMQAKLLVANLDQAVLQ